MEDKKRETLVTFSFALTNLVMFFVLAFTGFINLFIFNQIAFSLAIPFFLANIILREYYKKYKQNLYYKKHVIICRIIAVTLTLIICGSPIIMVSFNRTKPFYYLKQAVYSCGVRSMYDRYTRAFPDFLPRECEDYYFKVMPSVPAPEHRSFAKLSFYTDEETMEKYEREFAEKGYETVNSDKSFEDIMIEKKINLSETTEEDTRWITEAYISAKGVPYYIINFTEEEKLLNLSHDVIVYDFRSRLGFTSGCLLDYDSGLVIFWA